MAGDGVMTTAAEGKRRQSRGGLLGPVIGILFIYESMEFVCSYCMYVQ